MYILFSGSKYRDKRNGYHTRNSVRFYLQLSTPSFVFLYRKATVDCRREREITRQPVSANSNDTGSTQFLRSAHALCPIRDCLHCKMFKLINCAVHDEYFTSLLGRFFLSLKILFTKSPEVTKHFSIKYSTSGYKISKKLLDSDGIL